MDRKSRHGICLPLFCLRSHKNFGIGEYLDLIPMIDWCKSVGFDTLQLLPLNDTKGSKSPYDGFSVFALNPIHLSLPFDPPNEINLEPLINYVHVNAIKNEYMKKWYERDFQSLSKTDEYNLFLNDNPWLKTYLSFQSDPDFASFLQYHAFNQMERVKQHAEKNGIELKGDIPILLSKKSVDVLTHPILFLTDLNAGAPPDMFAPLGQNWRFPLYDWKNHFDGLIDWWKERLLVASKLYHLYRIDHVVGLYRIWCIPEGQKAVHGHFVPQDPNEWIPLGERILSQFLEACPMHPIAEDLGVVSPEIRTSLTRLGIPGTKVCRWEKDYHGNSKFIPGDQYPRLSMTTLATHDTQTLAEWWQKEESDAKEFADLVGIPYDRPLKFESRMAILKFAHHTNSLFHINLIGDYLALFNDLVHPHFALERINNPSRMVKENWCYRMRPFLEDFARDERLKDAIAKILGK